MKKECEARLRGLVPPDEPIAAVGTAEELRSLGPDIGSGGGWTFIVVPSERLLFAPLGSPQKPHEEIPLDDVMRWASGTQYNCEALVLTHPPMTRRERVPAPDRIAIYRPNHQPRSYKSAAERAELETLTRLAAAEAGVPCDFVTDPRIRSRLRLPRSGALVNHLDSSFGVEHPSTGEQGEGSRPQQLERSRDGWTLVSPT